jgi:hypothetical protein
LPEVKGIRKQLIAARFQRLARIVKNLEVYLSASGKK